MKKETMINFFSLKPIIHFKINTRQPTQKSENNKYSNSKTILKR